MFIMILVFWLVGRTPIAICYRVPSPLSAARTHRLPAVITADWLQWRRAEPNHKSLARRNAARQNGSQCEAGGGAAVSGV